MKLTYEQMRQLADIGDTPTKLTVKNKKGKTLTPYLKKMGTKPVDGDNRIHVYGGAAETVPCPYGEPFGDLPTSYILAAPTASGKTMIILNLLLRYYKDMFARIWMFSPSIKLDPQYAPLRKYLEKMTDQQLSLIHI